MEGAAVKVYGVASSPFVATVLLCLEEVGAAYEVIPVDLAACEEKAPAHLARNPLGKIPALEDGDLTLFESRPIARHVLRKHKPELLGIGNMERSATVDVWLEVEAHQFHPSAIAIVRECIGAPLRGRACDQAVVDENVSKLRAVLEVYEARLGRHRYLAGNNVSIADLNHFTLMHYFMSTEYGPALLGPLPRVKAWWEELAARPAARKVATFMPLDFGVDKKKE
ncbi:hypothetical protein EJB05_33906 [Eragrostis curvula]|uniref:glutathione transferase n=1 Tax=Eragrostis curvula TaxID=38414 RepID=A0A5J9U2K4_9POAL|nr:hypothetical protein EJB05_33906 [Eragrostis curvula]